MAHTHAQIHTRSLQSCSASTPCNPSDKLQRLLLLLSSFLLLRLPRCTPSFQLQLDLDKDGFSFSFVFFPALAKEGFACGDYTQSETRIHAHAHRLQRGDTAFEEKHLH